MSVNVSAVTNHFPTANKGFITTTSSTITSGVAQTTVPLTSVSGLTNATIFVGILSPGTASEREFTGTVDTAGSQITGVKWTDGLDATHTAGTTIVDYVAATGQNMQTKGMLVEHKQTGAHSDITADSIVVTGDVTAANFIQSGGSGADGWTVGLPAVSSVTANGNRSYDIEFASDVSGTLSEGMRLRTTRTVAATQNAFSLDGSNDYYNKTSPTGITFTTTFTCSAWVYLTSYAEVGIIARRNADTEGWSFGINSNGQLSLVGLRIAANNKSITSYQSIPLGKWVHVAACIDMTAGDTAAQIMWIDGVSVPRFYSLTGTATAIVQGTTALVVGALKSAGTGPFPGYIDQAAVFSSQLSDATIKAMMHQGLTGSESTLVSAYANGSTTDLSANANNLTAQNGATTVASAPWGNRGASTTLDYGLVMAVSGTDVTVQVPEGVTIPTTGGITSVAYSTFANPYGFVSDKGRWEVKTQISSSITTATPISSTYHFFSSAFQLTVPIGKWAGRLNASIRTAASGNTYITHSFLASTTTSAAGKIPESSFELSIDFGSSTTHAENAVSCTIFPFSAAAATPVYVGYFTDFNGSAVSVSGFYRNDGSHYLTFTPSNL